MDISTDMLIDLGLNLAGFLTAGGLMLVIYSAFHRKKRVPRADYEDHTDTASDQHQPPATSARSTRGMEFINFQEAQTKPDDMSGAGFAGHSRRAAVIKMARDMLSAGSTNHDVKAALPISDTELALLNFERK